MLHVDFSKADFGELLFDSFNDKFFGLVSEVNARILAEME